MDVESGIDYEEEDEEEDIDEEEVMMEVSAIE